MKAGPIICFVLAGVTALSAINSVFLSGGGNRPAGSSNLIGYGVGAFLLPMVFLIVGLMLHNKPPVKSGKSNRPKGKIRKKDS